MHPDVAELIIAAERDAQRLAAYVRGLIAILLIAVFTLVRPDSLPTGFIVVIYVSISSYLVLGIVAHVLAAPHLFRPWMAGLFFALDLTIYAGVLFGAAHAAHMPLAEVAALPPFLFIFMLLALTAMRFTVWAVAAEVLTVMALGILWVAAEAAGWTGSPDTVSMGALPVWSQQANMLRVVMVGCVGLILFLTVRRTRRLLIDAITVTRRTENLSRYLPPAIAERAADEGIAALGQGRIQPAAVLFADIVGFTALAERLEPETLCRTLGDLRVLQRDVIERHGGIVDKFIGDAVMAVFGVPDPAPDDGRRALDAALEMESAVAAWNTARERAGLPLMPVGIGLHYGDVFAGAIGDAKRLEFASIGDTVNVAQRVETMTRQLDVSLLVTQAALDAAGADPGGWEALPPQAVKGRYGAVTVCRRLDV